MIPQIVAISFFVAGVPVAQPRVRAVRRGKHAGVYTPNNATAWKSAVIRAATESIGETISSNCQVFLAFALPRPKGHFKKSGELRSTAPTSHTSKPDVDNLAKSTIDALTNAGAFADDCLIDRLIISKSYAAPPHSIGCQIIVSQNHDLHI